MAWYRTGTVTVANGSPTVTGAGTDFVSNVSLGEAFRGPDGRTYEIASVVSATELALAETYMGGSGGGQTYAIQPTASFTRDLALRAATLLNTFGAVRDGIGTGLIADGSPAAPGIRFAADQDTGLARLGDNRGALVAGGQVILDFSTGGETRFPRSFLVSEGAAAKAPVGMVGRVGGANTWLIGSEALVQGTNAPDDGLALYVYGSAAMRMYTANAERMRIDASGNVLFGVTSASNHVIARGTAEGDLVMQVQGRAHAGVAFFSAASGAANGSACAFALNRNSTTGRSINAAGTINASGADYAEYMLKASGCGTIAKGDVCGVNVDGHLTKMWADAHSFVIKSTDPSYVGGDIWGQSVGPRPEGPGEEPAPPIASAAAPASEDEADVAAWQAIVAAYPAQVAAYQSAHAAWTTAKAVYDTVLPAWEAALEAERQKVDRIAFSGQVPVNVTGDFAVGDYIIAAASGAGIKAVAVPAADITFDQYRRRLGKVWAVRDGRAWVDVQHG